MRTLSKDKIFKLCDCSQSKPMEQIVQNGLALTPQKVKQLTERGIPVNISNTSILRDPDALPGVIPVQHLRGMDLNTAWEMSMRAKKTLINQFKNK